MEIDELKERWLEKTGETMPVEIQRMSIEKIRTAVTRTLNGETVFVPKVTHREVHADESMMEWDKHGELT